MTLTLDRFNEMREQGRLISGSWTGTDADGRETACWLSALVAEVGPRQTAAACPAEDLPRWFAVLITWMDDTTERHERWSEFAYRLGRVVNFRRSADQWHQAEFRIRAVIVREATKHTKNASVLQACETVIGLCRKEAGGRGRVSRGEFDDARAAAYAAGHAAHAAAAHAAHAAAAHAAAAHAAHAAAVYAVYAVYAAAAHAAAPYARLNSAARITNAILAILESQEAS